MGIVFPSVDPRPGVPADLRDAGPGWVQGLSYCRLTSGGGLRYHFVPEEGHWGAAWRTPHREPIPAGWGDEAGVP